MYNNNCVMIVRQSNCMMSDRSVIKFVVYLSPCFVFTRLDQASGGRSGMAIYTYTHVYNHYFGQQSWFQFGFVLE